VDYTVVLFEVVEGLESCDGHLAADGFRDGLFQLLEQLVKTSGHQLHANPNVGISDEASEA